MSGFKMKRFPRTLYRFIVAFLLIYQTTSKELLLKKKKKKKKKKSVFHTLTVAIVIRQQQPSPLPFSEMLELSFIFTSHYVSCAF